MTSRPHFEGSVPNCVAEETPCRRGIAASSTRSVRPWIPKWKNLRIVSGCLGSIATRVLQRRRFVLSVYLPWARNRLYKKRYLQLNPHLSAFLRIVQDYLYIIPDISSYLCFSELLCHVDEWNAIASFSKKGGILNCFLQNVIKSSAGYCFGIFPEV